MLLILGLLAPPTLAAAGDPSDCTVLGTEGPDVLEATDPEGDVVCGLGGSDVLLGGPGDDELRGGPGADRLLGGDGDDLLIGGPGPDRLDGGSGRDTLDLSSAPKGVVVDLRARTARGDGRDRLRDLEIVIGSRHDDRLVGRGGPETLAGGRGADILEGRGGRDVLEGGAGHDTIVAGRGRDAIDGGSGRDACLQGERRGPPKRGCEVRALGTGAGLTIFLPTERPVGVTFHESLFGSAAPMRPHGRLVRSDNPRFRRPPPSDGPPYVVMYSRGRAPGPTTASDFVVRREAVLRSPVTGRVAAVRSYLLYCSRPDIQMFLVPDGRPDLRVALFHVTGVRVRPGDRVIAGVTPLARAREFAGSSAQENEYFPGPYPHVHLEIERKRAMPVPGCR